MIRNYNPSLRRDIVGLGLCALVAILALTKAPQSVAELVSGEPLSMNFQNIPITKVVESIVDFSGGPREIAGLEQLSGVMVTVQINSVPARDALKSVLNCAGFDYEERGEALAIVRLEVGFNAACGAGMKLE